MSKGQLPKDLGTKFPTGGGKKPPATPKTKQMPSGGPRGNKSPKN